ncbi:Prefoldin subunit domain containing protein [Naviculisporaceae sp. PSN 640]
MTQSGQQQELSIFDQQVLRLEAKVQQLQASLTKWQQWYFDYSALKEEVDNVISDPSFSSADDGDKGKEKTNTDAQRKELARIRRDFESDLLTKKEINELFGKNDLKSADVISGLIGRRIDYVERNLETLKKLIETEEGKLAKASIVARPDMAVDEETGLPITDIVEKLDDDDNVLDFQLRRGGDAEPAVIEALKKLGIEEGEIKDGGENDDEGGKKEEKKEDEKPKAEVEVKEEPKSVPESPSVKKNAEEAEKSPSQKKSVSFAEDTKPGHTEVDPEPPKSAARQRLEEAMKMAKEIESMDLSDAVIPENESPEHAELRRKILAYNEIGPVVAELEIDNDTGDDEEEGWDDDFDDSDEEYDDDEDELGRSQHSVITDGYIKRMQELEKRLGFQSHFTVPKPEPMPEGQVGRIAVVPPTSPAAETAKAPAAEAEKPSVAGPKVKKGVRFAPQLDIADETKKPAPKPKKTHPTRDIVEKENAVPAFDEEAEEEEEEEEEAPKRVSRFKKERKAVAKSPAAPRAIPKGPHQLPASFFGEVAESNPAPRQPESLAPKDKVMADEIIERKPTTAPRAPGDVEDDQILYQAAAVEYHKMRNKMIQQQGGFVKQPEREIIPLDEDEGGPPRMSRFKAARLGNK